ncbi:MAG: helix-turn-helix domain-containing protein [Candidatus Bathyarchaeota archaeon]|nr:helix-turn-helix domain-containing protein [Candidatus Bathyarchaeota archaeon]
MRRNIKTSKPGKAIHIVDDPESIRLLADFTRTEILRLLSKYPMTETQLSEQLGITRAAVGYHLHLLLDTGLITIEKVEAEQHGILQKYYTPIAFLLIIDPDLIPRDVQRYFIRTQLEHLRGMFSVFQLYHHVSEVSSKNLEKLAIGMLKQLKIVGQKHTDDVAPEDAESLRIKIYAEALANLTKQKEWCSLFQK